MENYTIFYKKIVKIVNEKKIATMLSSRYNKCRWPDYIIKSINTDRKGENAAGNIVSQVPHH